MCDMLELELRSKHKMARGLIAVTVLHFVLAVLKPYYKGNYLNRNKNCYCP